MTKVRSKIHTITDCALFAAIICLVSPFSVPVGMLSVTLSVFAVVFTGAVLPFKKAFFSVIVYILAGCIGLPVFSGFRGGISCVFGLTGGFIWSYLPCVSLVSFSQKYTFKTRLFFAFSALALCYFCGTSQYMIVSGAKSLKSAFMVCVFPFIPFDIIKIVTALFFGHRVSNILRKQKLL